MSHYGAWRQKAAQVGRPTQAHFELTYRCNVSCRHCFQDRKAAPDELTLKDWKRVVDELRDAGVLVITLSGGEALVSPHFWPLAEHIRARGLAFRLYTNGVMLTSSNCRRLAKLQPASVEISIFSLDAAVHDGVTRAPGSLRKALRGVARLHHLHVPTKIKCPLLDTSSGDFRDVRALAERFGCSVLFDPGITPRFNGELQPTTCRGDDVFLLEYFEDPATRQSSFKRTEPRRPDEAICGIARSFTVVAPDGRVLPCTHLQQSAGNVREQTWLSVWDGAPLLKTLRETTWKDLPTCGSCSRSGYCGRCSAVALLENGDFHGPSSRACHIAGLKEQAWGIAAPPPAPTAPSKRLRILSG